MQGILPQQNINHSPKLLDQARGILRAKHFSYKTEQSYINWMKRYVLFHNKRHPRDENDEKIKNVPLFCKSRPNRLDRTPISAARGSVQPAFYTALNFCYLRKCVDFSPVDAAAFRDFFCGKRLI